MVRPCCMPLNKGVYLASIVEITISIIFLCANALQLAEFVPDALVEQKAFREAEESLRAGADNVEIDTKRFKSMLTVLTLLNTSFWLSSLLLGGWLYIASKQKDLRKCRTWFVVTCILTVLYIVEILMETFSMSSTTIQIISPIVGTLLQTYMLWVVSSYMDELRLGGCVAIKSGDKLDALI